MTNGTKRTMGWRGLAVALVALLTAVLMLSTGAEAKRAKKGACDASKGVLKRSQRVVVHQHPDGTDSGGSTQRDIEACMRPRGASFLVEIASLERDDAEYGVDLLLTSVAIGGPYVAVTTASGDPSAVACGKYMGQNCPPSTTNYALVAIDARNGRSTKQLTTKSPALAAPLVSSAGALVWLDSDGVHGLRMRPQGNGGLRSAPVVLATGAIPAGSVQLHGLIASWTVDGVRHTARVG